MRLGELVRGTNQEEIIRVSVLGGDRRFSIRGSSGCTYNTEVWDEFIIRGLDSDPDGGYVVLVERTQA